MREEIRSGRATRERKLAVCSGAASLDPEERAELLAVLAADPDEMIAPRAAAALLSQPPAAILTALGRADVSPQLFHYCAKHLVDKPGIADALVKNLNCPARVLLPAVRHVSTSTIQGLMDDLDRLSSTPALAAALAASPSLSAEQRQQLQELQQETSDPTALEEAVAAAEPDHAKRQTLLQRLSHMRVPERVQLALRGGREERLALIRDPCKVVQRAVLQSPRITDREVEAFAAMANLSDEVLRLIATSRKYIKNYSVLRNLMNNPKTPLDITLHMLGAVTPQDLKLLAGNRNIPETLRTAANRLQMQRKKVREE
ncbi:MAG: hypothetical protein HY237_15220 [Acidobacteria bacterium]|nr:hypothetical protein [Acidobacteriota bacterium]